MEDKSKEYWLALIYDSFTRNIEEDDAKELQNWQAQSAENQAFYDEAILFFGLMDFGIPTNDYDMGAAYQEFLEKQQSKESPWYKRLLPYAAVAAGLIIAFFTGTYLKKEVALHEGREMVIIVDKGSKSKTVLPDGTEVWLNSATKLEVDRNFGDKERRIKVEGEAYFDVTHDQQRPFIIETSSLEVKVHGTSFNLSCYPEEEIRVALVEGAVELISDHGQSMFLRPNEVVAYRAKTSTFHKAKEVLREEYGWRESKFVFKNRKFELIASQLERMFNVEIEIIDQKILNKRFTGDFVNNEGITEILDIMAKVGEFSYRMKGRQIQIY